jgi:hypothetical protein
MTPWSAFRDGVRRVNGAPLLLAGMVAVTLLIALPLSFVLRDMIETHLGRSLAADAVADGTSSDWWQEFSGQASGLGTTFAPSIIGFGAVLDNLSGLLDNLPLAATITGATGAWMAVWTFLSGGVLDRLARARPTRAPGFFAACGVYFWRFVRLGAVAGFIYYLLFAFVHDLIFVDLYEPLTRNLTVERTAFAVRAACYLLFGSMLAAATLVFDYARIRIVVEDRRSALGGLVAGLRFAWRRAGGTITLYLLNAAAYVLVVLVYAAVAPGAPRSGLSIWLVLAIGQIYIVVRHYLKLLFYGSQTAYFQGALAHAAYAAGPAVVWPDSPAAEAIGNADAAPLR